MTEQPPPSAAGVVNRIREKAGPDFLWHHLTTLEAVALIDALCKQRVSDERMMLLRAIGALSWCVGWINAADKRAATYPERELRAIQDQLGVVPSALASTGEQPDCGDAWLPIETAPKDGTRLLLWLAEPQLGERLCFGSWRTDDFTDRAAWPVETLLGWVDVVPTRWMPPPEPPTDAGGLSSTETEEDFGEGSV